jgi:hypothetical protein
MVDKNATFTSREGCSDTVGILVLYNVQKYEKKGDAEVLRYVGLGTSESCVAYVFAMMA